MKKFLVSTAVAMTAATGALASGPTIPVEPYVAPMPPMPVVYDWSGAYAGVNLLGGRATFTTPGDPGLLPHANGIGLGGLLGYNLQSGTLVYGGEVHLGYGNLDGSAPCPNPTFECTSDVGAIGSLRGRVGIAADRTLFYAGLGLTAARVSHTADDGFIDFEDTNTLRGASISVGVDHALQNGIVLRGEFEHTRFRSQAVNWDFAYPTSTRMNLLRVGALFRF
ncbi:MAG: outer membrane protein [Pararhodobacter sp.]